MGETEKGIPKFLLVTGGCRSGKSRYAIERAKELSDQVTYVATCQPRDDEMHQRIEQHRRERPNSWKTIEANLDLAGLLTPPPSFLFLIDCLTLWISAHLIAGRSRDWILKEAQRTLEAIEQGSSSVIVVTNEVGSGIVPENSLARAFRDIAGEVNQLFAKAADEVIWMVAGIPVEIKSQKEFLYEYPSSAKI